MQRILKAENINWSVKGQMILSDISFELNSGSRLGISGESGSGKTTLAKIIAGLIVPDTGKISINFNSSGNNKLLVLFQNSGELIHPFRKPRDIISEAIKKRGINSKNEIDSILISIIQMLNIPPELLDRKGGQLSGGEQQRVGLARLLAMKPELLIVDEPFSSQDPESSQNIIDILNTSTANKGMTLICISHDLKSLVHVSDEIMILYQGKIVEINRTQTITKNPKHPYTQFLLRSADYRLNADDFNSI